MKKFTPLALALVLLTTLTSCDAVGAVFEAGKWYGIIIAAIVIGLVFFLFGRSKK